MKKNVLLLAPLAIALAAPLLLAVNKNSIEVEAYDINSLPTTINLNDTSNDDIRNYYANLNSLSANERTGSNLLKNLKPILKNNQKYYSYDSGAKVWQAYEITDRDWTLSPAKDIEGYDASTNTITSYKYGESAAKPGSNPYIHALYVNREVDNNVHAWAETDTTKSSHGDNKEWHIDREHIWPKSFGFEDKAQGGARGDLMHLWAGDSYVNSALHSNYFYGYVDTSKKYTDGASEYSYASGNLMGYSRTISGSDVTVFEPQNSDKGDIARAVFYMAARYNYLSGSDTDAIDSNNPNLEIVDVLTAYTKSGYMSSASVTGKIGLIQDLLEWNELDPVDEYEIHRNNLLFNNYTYNRNPFIDFPQWANLIWGGESKSADPSKDAINDAIISISSSNQSVTTSKTFKLSATVEGDAKINWTVSDSSILSLDKTTTSSGEEVTVTTLKAGKATITATVKIGEETYSKDCVVKVKDPIIVSTVSLDKTNITIEEGQTETLIAAVSPEDAENKKITWLTSDSSKVTISEDGEIKAIASTGNNVVTITALSDTNENGIADEGEAKATCAVKVIAKVTPASIIGSLPLPVLIAIGAAAVVIIIIIIIVLAKSKKARKMATKTVKKQIKSSTSSKSKSSSSKKKK